MSEVTRILDRVSDGDAGAAEELLPLVYEELRRLAAQKMAHESPGQVAFARDSMMAGTVGNDATVAVWDTFLRTPLLPPFKGHRHGVHGVAFSPDGRRLATNGGTADEAVKLWDLSTGRELVTLPGQGQIPTSVRFSPDGNWLAARNLDGQLHLWQAPSWEDIAAAETREGRQQ